LFKKMFLNKDTLVFGPPETLAKSGMI